MLRKLRSVLAGVVMTALLVTVGSPLVPCARAAQTDDEPWYAPYIEEVRKLGWMINFPGGSFGEGLVISRGDFADTLCRMFSWEIQTDPQGVSIPDLGNYGGARAVRTIAAHGIVPADKPFRPREPISRLEMAEMLVKALGYGDVAEMLGDDVETPFADVTEKAGYVRIAYDFGMTDGFSGPGNTLNFLPYDSVRREEAAVMLVGLSRRMSSSTDWLHGFYAFSSQSQMDLALEMDEVSLGWARLSFDSQDGLYLNTSQTDGNWWILPDAPQEVLEPLAQTDIPYNLNVYADTAATVTRPDGETTSVLELLLTDDEFAFQAIEAMVRGVRDYAGLTVDFEGLKGEEWRLPFADFLVKLRAMLPQSKTLYVCVPPDTWYHGYDYRAIGEVSDKVILMAHDYQYPSIPTGYVGTTKTYSPVTPIKHIYTALQHITDSKTGVRDKSKIALQISFGTAGFHIDEDGAIQNTTIYHPSMDTIAKRMAQEDTVYTFDQASRNPYITYYTEEGGRYLLWFEDEQAVDAKLSLARMFGITGVSVWRLGIIPNFPEIPNYNVWQVFADR